MLGNSVEVPIGDARRVAMRGMSALAEGAWMGSAQAVEVLDLAREGQPGGPERARRRGLGFLLRELSVPQATVVLATAFFVSAMLGAVRQVLFNAQFGAGDEASAYYAAFRLPDVLFSLIAGGALSSAMIPVLLATSVRQGEAAAWRLTRVVLTTLVATFAVLILIAQLFAPLFVSRILAPGFDAETTELTVRLTRIMLLQPLMLAVGSVALALLNSRNQFLLTALSFAAHNVALIGAITLARLNPGLGIEAPAVGAVAGGALQLLILLPAFAGRGALRPLWAPGDAGLREVVRLLIPNGLSVGVGYAGFIIDTAFASKVGEPEALAAIANAWLLIGLPISLLGQAVGQAAFPRMAAAAATESWETVQKIVLVALGAVVGLAIPAALGLAVLGRELVRRLFEHGEFDAVAGALTYDVLLVYAVALPAYVATEVISRGLVSLRDTRTPLVTNAVQLGGRVLVVSLLIGDMGTTAIPLAFALTASVETVALGAVLAVRLRRFRRPPAAHRGATAT
ncbi:MAG: murein biosynthesis integral membrane protein MurJ [Dehalococcoidia bacterium]